MKRYYYLKMMVCEGEKRVDSDKPLIEVFRTGEKYHVFYMENYFFTGTKKKALEFMEQHKNDDVVDILRKNGLTVTFEQTLTEGED